MRFQRRSEAGNTLVVTIIITGLIGALLAAYLSLVRSDHSASTRSQAWNLTIAVVEAGVEEALTHLNKHGHESSLAQQGWQRIGDVYAVKRYLGNQFYTVTISNWVTGSQTNVPVIESRGFQPLTLAATHAPGPILASAGTVPQSYVARGIRVTARQAALFSKGMVARNSINMGGGNIYADSFDSQDPGKSTNGKWDVNKRGDKGSIASHGGVLNIGAADVYGDVYTGPTGSFNITSGSVGDKAWVASNSPGIQPGHYHNDMNMDFPDVTVPFGGGLTPGSGTVGGVSYTYVLSNGDYRLTSMSLSGNSGKVIVTGNARLYVTGEIKMTGKASLTIASGGSLKLYAGGAVDLGGNGVMNNTGNAASFFLSGLPTCTSIKVHGNGTFYGVIYAPNADMTLNGGGSGDEDVSGATITKSVTFNGHFKFHYDEALARLGMGKGYVVTSWNEMTPKEVAAGLRL